MAAEAVGKFTFVEGRVDAMREGNLPAISVKVGDPVFIKDIIRTKSDSKAEIMFIDKNILRIGQRSRIDISEYYIDETKKASVIRLPRGKVQAIVPEETVKRISVSPEANRFEIHTPNAVAGVRGTDYFMFHERNISGLIVNEGMVCAYNQRLTRDVVCVAMGHMTFIDELNRPQLPRPVTNIETRRLEREVQQFGTVATTTPEAGRSFTETVAMTPPIVPDTNNTTPPITEVIANATEIVTVPSVEVGRTNLSGSIFSGAGSTFNFMSVYMKDVVFLAPSTGQKPSIWGTNSVTGNYSFGPNINSGNITNPSNAVAISDGKGLSADFQFNQWNTTENKWGASINNGAGPLSGGSYTGSTNFSGDASGTIGTNAISGTAKGTAK